MSNRFPRVLMEEEVTYWYFKFKSSLIVDSNLQLFCQQRMTWAIFWVYAPSKILFKKKKSVAGHRVFYVN